MWRQGNRFLLVSLDSPCYATENLTIKNQFLSKDSQCAEIFNKNDFSKLIPEFATLEVTDQELLLRSTILELLILKVGKLFIIPN